jgi:hypothetical protein
MATQLPGLVVLTLLTATGLAKPDAPVHFGRDVLPILSDKCFYCHGPDESHRKADRRLDTREGALEVKDGVAAIVPGQPDQSDLLLRILSHDAEEVMPPPKSNKTLTAAEIDILKRWIAAGAPWGKHWAFEKPERAALPAGGAAPANPIDGFVRERLRREKLEPSPEAPRHTLLRRLAFDLTGLPPSQEEARRFMADTAPGAVDRLVERLLESPHYGERMAMWWLDGARYSDTDGYQGDDVRENWPWRDWVIESFNRNKPFDQFTIEQFAGDLLPGATAEQKLATCFHRNHMTNGEGGRDPEESRIDYVIDRVNTVGTLWMGLTLGCTQCHSHKFDPISHVDYYRLSAFFNNIDETGAAGKGATPFLEYQSPHGKAPLAQARELLTQRAADEKAARLKADAPFEQWLEARIPELKKGFKAWHPLTGALESSEGSTLLQAKDGIIQAQGPNPNQDDYRLTTQPRLPRITAIKLEVIPAPDGTVGRSAAGHFILTDVKLQVRRPETAQIREIAIQGAVADYSADPKKNKGYGDVKGLLDDDPRNGWASAGSDPKQGRTALFALAEPLVLAKGEELIFEMRQRSTLGEANIARFRVLATDQAGPATVQIAPAPLEDLAAQAVADPASVEPALRARLFEQFLADHPPYLVAKSAWERANRQFKEILRGNEKLRVMVLAEKKEPRETHVLVRGLWDKKGEKVGPGILPAIAPWTEGEEPTRLGLARWIVSRDNPLTARVMVNHLWQFFFGAGLVRTPEDFGLQGQQPTHPELLDWLACELMEHSWDLKHMVRLITTSATYRQSSNASEALLAKDPSNRLLARAARFRLPSWMLRDAALANSGLLNSTLGGPPIRPYQPEGVWEEIFMGRLRYEPSEGALQYRRTVYAFWRRSAAPTFLFDAAQRRVCEVQSMRTNTPLQALTLLNDETFLEASRALAVAALKNAPNDPDAALAEIYRRVLFRSPGERELGVLRRSLEDARNHYRQNPREAGQFVAHGQDRTRPLNNAQEVAAYMLTASLVLNLDEAITHE